MGLIALAVVCVPWMLLSKPLILYVQNRLKNRKKIENFVGDIPLVEMNSSTDLPHDDHPPHLDHDHDDEDDDEEVFFFYFFIYFINFYFLFNILLILY